MTTLHDPIYFVAGDTWKIAGQLLDANGVPFDIATATSIEWLLNSVDGTFNHLRCDLTSDGGITIVNAAEGRILVMVDEVDTAAIPPGIYKDWCRIVSAGDTFTEWNGFIRVAPNPATA